MSLVSPGLYLGSKRSSENLKWLQETGITLVVNVSDDLPCLHADSGGIDYVRVDLQDLPSADLLGSITSTSPTSPLPSISHALSSKNSSVLVHCRAGSSRSASVVLAHLVSSGATLMEAYKAVAAVHPIKPNRGFTAQLIEFEIGIRGEASVVIDGFGNWKAPSPP